MQRFLENKKNIAYPLKYLILICESRGLETISRGSWRPCTPSLYTTLPSFLIDFRDMIYTGFSQYI